MFPVFASIFQKLEREGRERERGEERESKGEPQQQMLHSQQQ